MARISRGIDLRDQTPLEKDKALIEDLSCKPSDADDGSDAGRPTTDHDATGWRAIDPVKP